MSNRRRFLAVLTGACGAVMSCSTQSERDAGEDDVPLVEALRELNDAAGIGITPDDFESAKDYASGAHLEARAKLRPIVLDESMDLPVTFAAKRGGR